MQRRWIRVATAFAWGIIGAAIVGGLSATWWLDQQRMAGAAPKDIPPIVRLAQVEPTPAPAALGPVHTPAPFAPVPAEPVLPPVASTPGPMAPEAMPLIPEVPPSGPTPPPVSQAVVVPRPRVICEFGPRAFDPLLNSVGNACEPPPLYYGPPPTPPLPVPPLAVPLPLPCLPPFPLPPPEPPGPTPACRPVPVVGEPVAGLGVTVTFADEGGGVLVLSVAPDSPAAFAGLLRGDRILAINHQLISSPATLTCYIHRKLPGSRIFIAYWRYGAIQATSTVLVPKEAIPGGQPEVRPVPIWQAHGGQTPSPLNASAQPGDS